MRKIFLLLLYIFATTNVFAQFILSAPTRDGSIGASEYGNHTNNFNQWSDGSRTWYMTWDNTNLYLAVSSNGNATDDELVIYIDTDPQTIVNGGADINGCTGGIGTYDGNNYGVLPFRANFNTHITNGYHQHRISNNNNTWPANTDNSGSITKTSSGNVQEIAIAWSLMGGRPAAFNIFFYINGGSPYGGLSNYGANTDGTTNTNLTGRQYFNIASTADGSSTVPFSRLSYVNPNGANTLTNYGTAYYNVTANSSNTITIDNNLGITNLLLINTGSTLVATGVRTITFSGASSTLGLQCDGTLNPNNGASNDINIVASSGTTTFSGSAANTAYRIFNLTVNAGATVQAPSSGTVDLGWQFGTITVANTGVLNFVNGGGVVNLTNSGTSSTVNITNSGVSTFNNVTNNATTSGTMNIANNSTAANLSFNTITNNASNTFRPATSPSTSPITIRGSLTNTGSLSTTNTGTLDITVTGTGTLSSSTSPQFYRNLIIANTGSTSSNSVGVTISGAITIVSGRTLTINSGARLITSNSITLTTGSPDANCVVNGFLRSSAFVINPLINSTSSNVTINNGATFESNVTAGGSNLSSVGLPIATWNTGSTCSVIGLTSPTAGQWFGAGATQTFSNFTFDCPSLTTVVRLSSSITATGTFTMANTNSTQLSFNFNGSTNSISCGNFVQTGGTINLSSTDNATGNGTINCSGTFNQSGGTITESGTGTANKIVLNAATGNQNVTVSGTISNTISWEVGTGSSANTATLLTSLVLGTGSNFSVLTGSSIDFGTNNISGGSAFTLNSGATLISANIDAGVLTPTSNTTVGSVRVGGTKTYNAAANYIFNGAAAQTTGSSFLSAANVTISNSSGVALTAATNLAIIGNLVLSSGAFNLGSNTLTYSGSSITRTGGTITATSASLVFTNTVALTLPASLFTGNINTLTINGAGGVTLGSATTVSTNLNLTSGTLTNGANLTLGNGASISRTTGTLSSAPTFGTAVNITYLNSSAINPGNEMPSSTTVLNNLTLSGTSGAVTLLANTQVNGNLSLTTGSNLNFSTFTLTYAGSNIIRTSSGFLTISGTASLNFINTSSCTLPTALFNSNTLSNLTINGAGGVTLGSSTTVSTALNLTAGVLDNSTNNITLSNSATITRAAGSLSAAPIFGTLASHRVNVTITGTVTSSFELLGTTGGVGTLTCSSGTYTFSGVLPQIDALTTSGGTLQYENTTTVRSLVVVGNVTNTSGTITVGTQGSAVAHTLTIGGNFTRSGTFTVTNGSGLLHVTFNGTTNQTISGTAGTVFNNVVVSNSGGAILNVTSTITINNTYTLTVNNGSSLQASVLITVQNTSSLVLNTGSTLYIATTSFTGGVSSVPASVAANSTIVYTTASGGGTQSITGSINYANLTITGARAGSNNISWSTAAVTLTGNFVYDATFSSGSLNMNNGGSGSRLEFAGSGTQNVTINSPFYVHTIVASNVSALVVSFAGSGTLSVGVLINLNANATLNFGTLALVSPSYSFSNASNSATLNSTTAVTLSSANFILPGQSVSGAGIQVGTTVVSYTSPNLVLSLAATTTGTSTLTFSNVANSLSTTGSSASSIIRTQNTSATPLPTGTNWNGITMTFDGSSTQYIPTGTYRKLLVSNNCEISAGSTYTQSTSSTSPSLAIGANKTLTVNGTLINPNTLTTLFTYGSGSAINFGSTGVYTLSSTTTGQIPIGTWNAASTLNINLTGDPTTIADRGQTFGIVNWNCPSQNSSYTLGTSSFQTQGLFTITSTGTGSVITGASTLPTMTVGAFTVTGSSTVSITGSGAGGNRALTVNGDYTQSGTSTVNITGHNTNTGTLEVKGNFNKSAGTLTNSGGGIGTAFIILSGASSQTFSTNSLSNDIDFTVNNASGITLNSAVSYSGNLTLTAGALNNSTNNITVANGKTISRAAGSLTAAPVFGASGTDRVAVTITGTCTAGNELAGTTGGIGTLTVNNNATYTLNADRTLDAISVASGATIDGAAFVLTPRASGAATIAGSFKTANLVGFSGSATAAISSTNSPTFTLTGSTIEYNAASASQVITARSDYNNLTLSGAFAKAISGSTTIGGNLNFNAAADILTIGSNTLTLNGTETGSGSLRGSATSNLTIGGTGALGTINFDQSTDGTTNVLNDVIVNRITSGTLSLGNKLVIVNSYTPTAGTLTTGDFLHIRSTASNTARIAAGSSGGGYISGDVTVERHLTANTNRAYRLLTPGVTTSTNIRANWQEGTNNPDASTNNIGTTDYGTHITGSGGNSNGFDVTQNNQSSVFLFDQGTQNWTALTNTNVNTLNAKTGYLAFIRGNRNSIATINTTTGSSNTTLRATGTLAQGTQTFTGLASDVPGGDAEVSLVTNPFAAPISWASFYTGSNATNFENFITIWDPNVNTRGGFITVTNGGSTSGGTTNLTTNIQSGQAFFVTTKSGINSPTLTILESDKSTTNNLNVFRNGPQTEQLNIQLKYINAGITRSADGVLALFSNSYNNNLDGNDAEQIANWDEDVALLRNGKALSIESRDLIDDNDSLFIKIANINKTAAVYTWEIAPTNFNAPGLQAWLLDKFTNTTTPISLIDTTRINFTVSSNLASQVSDRFTIVFKTTGVLPVTITQLKATQKNNKVEINFTTVNEINIDHYVVEKSSNAVQFTTLQQLTANGSGSYTADDANTIQGANYYRVKIVEQNGRSYYSNIVKIIIGKTGANDFVIYPNPVKGNSFSIQLVNKEKGVYVVQLSNANGQTIVTKSINHLGGSLTVRIPINATLSQGIYQLKLVDEHGNQQVQQLIKE